MSHLYQISKIYIISECIFAKNIVVREHYVPFITRLYMIRKTLSKITVLLSAELRIIVIITMKGQLLKVWFYG